MNLRDTYNKIAEDWHKDHQVEDWWIEGTDTFVSFLSAGDEVLDVGCGSGLKSGYLIKKSIRVLGVDFSEKLIDIARREVPEAEFLILDMRDLSGLAREFNGVFTQASLLHIPKKEAFSTLQTLVSKLKSGGYLYIAVKGIRSSRPHEEIREESDYGYTYQRFFSYYTMGELKEYFALLELEVVWENIKTSGKTDWLQIIGKKS